MTSAASSRVKKPQSSKPAVVGQQVATAWQGPLPPPDALEKFNAIVENGAERVFRMAEIEQQHRIESERAALESNIQAAQAEGFIARQGHRYGAAISILAIVATIISVAIGAHWSVSVALVGVPLMSAVRALILRK
jgi:uncharacterized membrane protein